MNEKDFIEFIDEHESEETDTSFRGKRFHYDKDFQNKICAYLIRNKLVFVRLHQLVLYDYFIDNFNREVYKIVKKYYQSVKDLPSKEIIYNELVRLAVNKNLAELYRLKLDNLFSIVIGSDESYIVSTVKTFALKLRGIKLITNFSRYLDTCEDEESIYVAYNRLRTDLVSNTFVNNLGVQIFSPTNDFSKMYTGNLSKMPYKVPVGLATYDSRTMGGLTSGEVGTILGVSGIGKSMVLVNFCKAGAMTSCPYIDENNNEVYNPVVYITQELSEEDVHIRFMSSITGIPMGLFYKYRINPKLLSKEDIDLVEKALDELKNINYYIRIKYFKPKELTPQLLWDYLYELEYYDKVKIRGVYHDYLKKLSYEGYAKDDYKGFGYITTQLISIAKDFNVPIWSPMQLNRLAKLSSSNDSSKIGNSWEIFEDLDSVLVINQSIEEERENIIRIKCDKMRRSESGYEIYAVLDKRVCQLKETSSVTSSSSSSGGSGDGYSSNGVSNGVNGSDSGGKRGSKVSSFYDRNSYIEDQYDDSEPF